LKDEDWFKLNVDKLTLSSGCNTNDEFDCNAFVNKALFKALDIPLGFGVETLL
jgi:hypothetical protein